MIPTGLISTIKAQTFYQIQKYPTVMKAVQVLGSEDSHKIVFSNSATKPSPHNDQILVKVHAAGITADEVSWPELYNSSTRIPGHDVSGIVDVLGPSYTGPLKVGQEVFAMVQADAGGGCQAEYVLLSAEEAALKPASVSHAQAAALPIPFLTAWEAIFQHAKVQKGSKVLVTGASGAVGRVMIQLAAGVLGCQVTGLASTKHHDSLKELGASILVDYCTPNWEDAVTDMDAVLDAVGSETLARSWKCLQPNGSIVTIADPPPPWAFGRGKPKELEQYPKVNWVYFIVTARGEILANLDDLLNKRKIQALPVKAFAADESLEAWKYAGQRGREGKVVIEFGSNA
ncbi:hypothetical protein QQS21_007805 [Conoideocrella luteorostrata]|uniref:Enoyl reductase (ER) domain-containing protein n=1 Tax=Conoideocrella luteorostrata TaxID=1105319 RepID=A0AAJ0CK50_9HYPO|nr:hypothetical protein QQS21_007805 [Conoideocrella luteorostrata]